MMKLYRWFRSASLGAVLLFASGASWSLANPYPDNTTPWLAGVTTNSVYVSLETTNTSTATVDFGLTAGYVSSATTENYQSTGGDSYVHNIKMTDLSPDTVYHYQVTQDGVLSGDYSFRTAPSPGTAAHWGFAADCRSYPSTHNAIAAQIDSHNPNMMVYGGDLCASPTYSSWKNEWFVSSQKTLNARAPFVNGTGNHEDWGTPTQAFTHGPNGDGNGYYSFDYGDTHILVLNNEIADGPGSAQWDFAATDLAATNQKFKVVAFHQPAYVYGSHSPNGDMQAMTNSIFEPNGVDIVLAGHEHNYQHILLDDIHHMVIGSFGAPLYSPYYGPETVYAEQTTCYAIFDTDGKNTLTMRTYRGNGTPLETITIVVPKPSRRFLLPAAIYLAVDDDSDSVFDDLGDTVIDKSTHLRATIGELDRADLNMMRHLVAKYALPEAPAGKPILQRAVLRFYIERIDGLPAGPISVWHGLDDNDLEQLASDYEDPTYTDTLLDLVAPTDEVGAYYEVDVTDMVLADYSVDGESPLSAFRLQVNEAVFLEDDQADAYAVTMPGGDVRPQLLLTFIPEPSTSVLATFGLLGLVTFGGRRRKQTA